LDAVGYASDARRPEFLVSIMGAGRTIRITKVALVKGILRLLAKGFESVKPSVRLRRNFPVMRVYSTGPWPILHRLWEIEHTGLWVG
jgi:uncharacterized membrane protein